MKGFDSFEIKLGDELRGERATLGKSLLDVQRDLRIKAAYIAAIENCDTGVFPNKGFIAGYVRSYARYMNLDPDHVFRRFCAEANFDGVNAGLAAPKKSPSGRLVSSGPALLSKDDPILKPLRSAGDLAPRFADRVSLSGLGSLSVLVMLVAGLGYGGLSVLHSIQQVTIIPVEQRPDTLSEVAGIEAPGFAPEVQLTTPDAGAPSDMDIVRLYQPRELELPVLTSRDGPILEIDPTRSGLLGGTEPQVAQADTEIQNEMDTAARDPDAQGAGASPIVREAPGLPRVNVIAQRPAWIRVYEEDGTILFEKILETGETYTLPEDIETPLLRAGNAGSVYLAVNETTYGPVGTGTGVAKNVSLISGDIETAFARVVDVPEVVQATVSALETPVVE